MEFRNVGADTDASTIVKSLVRESVRPVTPNTTKTLKRNFPRSVAIHGTLYSEAVHWISEWQRKYRKRKTVCPGLESNTRTDSLLIIMNYNRLVDNCALLRLVMLRPIRKKTLRGLVCIKGREY